MSIKTEELIQDLVNSLGDSTLTNEEIAKIEHKIGYLQGLDNQ